MSLKSVGKFPNIRKKNKTVQLTEKQLSSIIEKLLLNKEENNIKDMTEEDNFERKETHGYERGELNKSGYDDSNNEKAMGFWGLETGSGESESSSLDKDFSSPSFDTSSDVFDLKESLKKELRKYV